MLSQWIIRLRQSPWMEQGKRFVPSVVRRAGWRLVHRQEIFNVLGSKMFLPPGSRHSDLMLNRYEPEVSKVIADYLKPGMTFVDVGANIGIFTLLAARLTGAEGRVLAFEPVPENFEVLSKNVAFNHYANVECMPKAVCSAPGKVRLFLSTYGGNHSLTADPVGFTGSILEVDSMRLDAVPGLMGIDLLKIDVEGSELEVIESLGTLPVGKILLEYSRERMQKRGLSGEEFLGRLRALGCEDIQDIEAPANGVERIRQNEAIMANLMMVRSMRRK